METQNDIRWIQRFDNFKKVLNQLRKFIDKNELSDLEKQGIIKAFEYTFELAWNTLKDFLNYQGEKDIYGSRDTILRSFQLELIQDGESWMNMLQSRNKTSHTYNEDTAEEVVDSIKNIYFLLFETFNTKMKKIEKNALKV